MICQTVWHREDYTSTVTTPQFTESDQLWMKHALVELNEWCVANSLTPHPAKYESMLFYRGSFIGLYPLITIGKEEMSWVCQERLLGITIGHKLTWAKHLTDLNKQLCHQTKLAKKMLFSNRKISLGLIFQSDPLFCVLRNHHLRKLQ